MSPPARSAPYHHPLAQWAPRAGLVVALWIATAALADNSISGFDEVTVAPGDTAQCQSNPCRVFLKIPAGDGSVTVTGNEVTWGTYPSGQTADLGQVFNSTGFELQGTGLPKAYVYMPNDL